LYRLKLKDENIFFYPCLPLFQSLLQLGGHQIDEITVGGLELQSMGIPDVKRNETVLVVVELGQFSEGLVQAFPVGS